MKPKESTGKEITCKNLSLERVRTFEYLRTILTSDEKIDGELTNRENKSTRMYHTLNKTILSRKEIKFYITLTINNTHNYLHSRKLDIAQKTRRNINSIEISQLRKINEIKCTHGRNEHIMEIIH